MAKSELSRAAIVARALDIADTEGLDAITVRRISQEFGVTPMALYWHVKNKDELLDAMGDALFDGTDAAARPGAGLARAAARAGRRAGRARCAAHPGAVQLAFRAGARQRRRAASCPSTCSTCCAARASTSAQTADIGVYALRTAVMLVDGEPGREVGPTEPGARGGARRQARRAGGRCRPSGTRGCARWPTRCSTATTRTTTTASASTLFVARRACRCSRALTAIGRRDPLARQPAHPAHPAARGSGERARSPRGDDPAAVAAALPDLVAGLGRRWPRPRWPAAARSRATPTPAPATTAGWTRCAAPAGRAPGRCPWSHEPNRGFLRALHALGPGGRPRSARTTRRQRCARSWPTATPRRSAALAGT